MQLYLFLRYQLRKYFFYLSQFFALFSANVDFFADKVLKSFPVVCFSSSL